jgi:hypothetical protein
MPLYIKVETPARVERFGPFPDKNLRGILAKARIASKHGAPRTVIQTCGKGRPSILRVYVHGEATHRFSRRGHELSMGELLGWVLRSKCRAIEARKRRR